MTKISFIYFDVGGVLLRDFSATDKWTVMQREMGVKPEEASAFDALYESIEVEVCKGKSIDSYLPLFRDQFDLNIPDNFSWLKYFADHIEENPSIHEAVAYAISKCRVGLLTDQYPGMLSLLWDKLPEANWDPIIDSSVEGVKKPEQAIFGLAESRARIPHREILFIENNRVNYEATLAYGWQGYLYDPHDHKQSSSKLLSYLHSVL